MKSNFKYILTAAGLHPADITRLGGKGRNLVRLQQLGLPVPTFVVVPHDILQQFLPKFDSDTARIEWIKHFDFPADLLLEISAAFSLEHHYFAVRSSATNEDGAAQSFAGQFETRLYITRETLPDALRCVWASAYSGRVQAYAHEHSVASPVGISIVVQVMVPADAAGVAFGIHPTEGDRNAKVISAVYGLGEGLVSGELDADTVVVRPSGTTTTLAHKPHALQYNAALQKVTQTSVAAALQDKPVLNAAQIEQICAVLDQLRAALGQPQDIEFAFEGEVLHLLQTRPVTHLSRLTDRSGRRIVWDNSNIVESYPGVTTPLTFSFILRMYASVYRQLAVLLGVPRTTVEDNGPVFDHMLGLLRGRVYYNLEAWYRILAMLPGYQLNARFMETMMGVKERFDLPETPQGSKTKAWFQILGTVGSILVSLVRLPASRRRFKHTLDNIIAEYNALDFDQMQPFAIMERYFHFENFLVNRWQPPLVNDFFAMIFFGILKKQCEKIAPDYPNLHNDLLAGSRDIVSTEPVRRIFDLTAAVLDTPGAAAFFKENTPEIIWQNRSKWPSIEALIDRYLLDFGERTVGELKLETITYTQNPAAFIAVIQSYVQQGLRQRIHNEEGKIRAEAEAVVAQALRGKWLKSKVLQQIIAHTRSLVSARENLRYERTRGFGMVRRMFTAIGRQFYAEQILDDPRDVFYLTRDEVFDYIKGTSATMQIRQQIALRKAEFEGYRQELPLSDRITTYGTVYHANDFRPAPTVAPLQAADGSIQGIGCSAGRVRARVRVVLHPDETPSLEGDILVTVSTDPGWVTLFPTASAILVERGSLLSHSAIVSRELGIPCIVGITGLLQMLQTGDEIEMDGTTGTILRLGRFGA